MDLSTGPGENPSFILALVSMVEGITTALIALMASSFERTRLWVRLAGLGGCAVSMLFSGLISSRQRGEWGPKMFLLSKVAMDTFQKVVKGTLTK